MIEGSKYDTGKLRYDLIPTYPLSQLASVYTYGVQKYSEHNWRKGIKFSRIFSALMRHCWSYWSGSDTDEESGLPHLSHAAWCLFTLLEYSRCRKELDDRYETNNQDGSQIL